ncbi:hypothetical protein L484_003709 [Morus notabilis]|uniref:Uncharacterized protein n=1 Tax=Morus notabilis TaxID=981085 RepID=W9R4Y9_9ROSA|nr:hypothetical protein L484_003709 [Morus notabilis]
MGCVFFLIIIFETSNSPALMTTAALKLFGTGLASGNQDHRNGEEILGFAHKAFTISSEISLFSQDLQPRRQYLHHHSSKASFRTRGQGGRSRECKTNLTSKYNYDFGGIIPINYA